MIEFSTDLSFWTPAVSGKSDLKKEKHELYDAILIFQSCTIKYLKKIAKNITDDALTSLH